MHLDAVTVRAPCLWSRKLWMSLSPQRRSLWLLVGPVAPTLVPDPTPTDPNPSEPRLGPELSTSEPLGLPGLFFRLVLVVEDFCVLQMTKAVFALLDAGRGEGGGLEPRRRSGTTDLLPVVEDWIRTIILRFQQISLSLNLWRLLLSWCGCHVTQPGETPRPSGEDQ